MSRTPDDAQAYLRSALLDCYKKLKDRNPRFSQRAFAQKLQVNIAILSGIFNRKRRVSEKIGTELLRRAGVEEAALKEFSSLYRNSLNMEETTTYLQEDVLAFVSDWPHFALISLLETEGFRSEEKYLAQRLGISRAHLRDISDRLVRLGLLERGPRNSLLRTGQKFRTTNGIPSQAVRAANLALLKKAAESLQRIPLEKRYETTAIMAVDPKRLNKARLTMQRTRDRMMKYLEGGKKTEVYVFSQLLYPVSKEVPRK